MNFFFFWIGGVDEIRVVHDTDREVGEPGKGRLKGRKSFFSGSKVFYAPTPEGSNGLLLTMVMHVNANSGH